MLADLVESWKNREQAALLGGGKEKIEKQVRSGKKTVRERIALLLDSDSFEEVEKLAVSPFLLAKEYTDGVVTGFGTISGRRVAVYAQDFTVKGGSLGKRHAEKICKIMDMAAKIGCPIIGLIDSGGARIDEGVHALSGYGQIFMRNSRYSGVVPQISVILGPCAGGAAYSPALTDFVFTTNSVSQMFITGPQVIEQVLFQKISKEDLGGALVHSQISGVAHFVSVTEDECLNKVKILLSYLPNNYLSPVDVLETEQTESIGLEDILPSCDNHSYDIKLVISSVVDANSFFEVQSMFAANIVIGFARINGRSVGIVANQPLVKAGALDIDSSDKAARFIRFCDSFEIPIISLVDVPGFLPGVGQEHNGIIRHGAKLLYAYACASVPKITIILRKAYGGAYVVMGSKELGADFNFAWPTAQIAVLGAKAAVSILHGREISGKQENEREAAQEYFEQKYSQEFLNPFTAVEFGYVDSIIEPNSTRFHISRALEITKDKVETLPKRKHGNIPL
jgi:acetyl-CoA carboxylase carboxyltransferase component